MMIRVVGVVALLAVGFGLGFPAERDTPMSGVLNEALNDVTLAMGLPQLRDARDNEWTEIRVWLHGGIVYPQELWQLKLMPTGWQGNLILFWPTDSELSCDDAHIGHLMTACYQELPTPPDWNTVLARLEDAGIWDLPDDSVLPPPRRVVSDGWLLTVELRAGKRYRFYTYNNPDEQRWPEAKHAVEIACALRRAGPHQLRQFWARELGCD